MVVSSRQGYRKKKKKKKMRRSVRDGDVQSAARSSSSSGVCAAAAWCSVMPASRGARAGHVAVLRGATWPFPLCA